eukprot:12777345-Ditylum_brightwellii.AAC.1
MESNSRFEDLTQFVGVGFTKSPLTQLITKDWLTQGDIFHFDQDNTEEIGNLKTYGKSLSDTQQQMVAYLLELAYDLCLAPGRNVSDNPGFESVLGVFKNAELLASFYPAWVKKLVVIMTPYPLSYMQAWRFAMEVQLIEKKLLALSHQVYAWFVNSPLIAHKVFVGVHVRSLLEHVESKETKTKLSKKSSHICIKEGACKNVMLMPIQKRRVCNCSRYSDVDT